MNKLFKKFLEEELTIEAKKGDFDYSFNNASTNDMFLEEYKKFLHIIIPSSNYNFLPI